jgi:hypothetical protein
MFMILLQGVQQYHKLPHKRVALNALSPPWSICIISIENGRLYGTVFYKRVKLLGIFPRTPHAYFSSLEL